MSSDDEKTYNVDIGLFNGLKSKKINIDLKKDDLLDLKNILFDINSALEKNDEKLFYKSKEKLIQMDLFDEKEISFLKPTFHTNTNSLSDPDISNKACFFSSFGSGFIAFPIETKILEWITEQASEEGGLGGIILAILLIIIFYVPVMLVTHLIPFRILMPFALVELDKGNMNSIGMMGSKSVSVSEGEDPFTCSLNFFTGLTISFPKISINDEEENEDEGSPFLFALGFAGSVENIEE